MHKEKFTFLGIFHHTDFEDNQELLTAILLIDGYNILSHRDLIDYLKEKYPGFTKHEISVLDDLRVLRNRVAYEGFFIEFSYLDRNESLFKIIIQKLKHLVEKKLG